ncbi:unnamed protein product, partial [Iphiclides podalirius]
MPQYSSPSAIAVSGMSAKTPHPGRAPARMARMPRTARPSRSHALAAGRVRVGGEMRDRVRERQKRGRAMNSNADCGTNVLARPLQLPVVRIVILIWHLAGKQIRAIVPIVCAAGNLRTIAEDSRTSFPSVYGCPLLWDVYTSSAVDCAQFP